jgi:hypothetical protein
MEVTADTLFFSASQNDSDNTELWVLQLPTQGSADFKVFVPLVLRDH